MSSARLNAGPRGCFRSKRARKLSMYTCQRNEAQTSLIKKLIQRGWLDLVTLRYKAALGAVAFIACEVPCSLIADVRIEMRFLFVSMKLRTA
jgi:hypothetical protein